MEKWFFIKKMDLFTGAMLKFPAPKIRGTLPLLPLFSTEITNNEFVFREYFTCRTKALDGFYF
jgi:hypothetical protein